jgi:hypothetical protein
MGRMTDIWRSGGLRGEATDGYHPASASELLEERP